MLTFLALGSLVPLLVLLCLGTAIIRRNPNQRRFYALIFLAYGELLPFASTLAPWIAGRTAQTLAGPLIGLTIVGMVIAAASILRLHSVDYPSVPRALAGWGFCLFAAAIGAVEVPRLASGGWMSFEITTGMIGIIIMAIGLVGVSRSRLDGTRL